MNELPVRTFLQALVRAGERMAVLDRSDPGVRDALAALGEAAHVLTLSAPEVVLTLSEDALFFGSRMLHHTSVEFNGLLSEMRDRGIDSITITDDAHPEDLADLAGVVAGSGELPVGGTVRLNERPLRSGELEEQPLSGLRRTYAASLEALRSLGEGGRLDMNRVQGVVEGFLGASPTRSLMLATVRNYDETTYYHSVNVCLLSMTLGSGLGLSEDELRNLAAGALLHDIGRVLLGEIALTKEGGLTSEEWAQVRLHPQEGAQAILAASGPGQETAAAIALEHHARIDGQGYPDLAARKPHFFSRIVSVVDAYDAITSRRPHRPARTPLEAMRILSNGSGSAFDPDVVAAFLLLMGEFPPGSMFRIRSGEVVMVTSQGGEEPPSGLVVRDPDGQKVADPRPVTLGKSEELMPMLAEDAGVDPAEMLEAIS